MWQTTENVSQEKSLVSEIGYNFYYSSDNNSCSYHKSKDMINLLVSY